MDVARLRLLQLIRSQVGKVEKDVAALKMQLQEIGDVEVGHNEVV